MPLGCGLSVQQAVLQLRGAWVLVQHLLLFLVSLCAPGIFTHSSACSVCCKWLVAAWTLRGSGRDSLSGRRMGGSACQGPAPRSAHLPARRHLSCNSNTCRGPLWALGRGVYATPAVTHLPKHTSAVRIFKAFHWPPAHAAMVNVAMELGRWRGAEGVSDPVDSAFAAALGTTRSPG